MINFYKFYNKTGLDDEHYSSIIDLIKNYGYRSKTIIPIMHIIKKYPRFVYYYATDIIKGRWIDGEPIILKDVHYSYYYSLYVIKDRWKEAEEIIMKSPEYAYLYTRDVIGFGRFHKAEPYIMEHPYYAYMYAKDIIGGRWKKAEPYIMKSEVDWNVYTRFIKNINYRTISLQC